MLLIATIVVSEYIAGMRRLFTGSAWRSADVGEEVEWLGCGFEVVRQARAIATKSNGLRSGLCSRRGFGEYYCD